MDHDKTVDGIRVMVRPSFSLPFSEPEAGRFVFTYRVEVENRGDEAAKLLFRHWHVHDGRGEDWEVDGEGVVGEQPTLAPGKSHVYESFCVLRSPVGFMEGYYTFARPTGKEFRVPIPRFDLRAPPSGGKASESDTMN